MGLWLLIPYAVSGGLLAWIDRLEDEGLKRHETEPIVLAIINSLLMGYLIVADFPSAIIFSAILLGVLIAGKIDNLPFILGALVLSGALLYRALTSNFLDFALLPAALAFAAFVDEFGNDKLRKIPSSLMRWFFLHRFTLKIGLFMVTFLGVITAWHFVAFLAFDLAYELVANKRV